MRWHLHDFYGRMSTDEVSGAVVIVIDVLRATTTIVTALAHGASRVLPVRSIEEARAAAAVCGGLLGGERGGERIEGFDFGNSPLEYTPGRVSGRPIVITTTNGTAAIAACKAARELVLGAVVNRSAVASAALDLAVGRGCDIHLVCAGTDGAVTEEDLLAAGAILAAAAGLPACDPERFDPAAVSAVEAWRGLEAAAELPEAAVAVAFATSRGGQNLIELGMEADLPAAAQIDRLPIVPRLDPSSGWLVVDHPAAG